mmetsp:Transcript_137100/g.324805  ORF Transcript_137100/g.324805 Transcript_137100/m.324805 type:complete len:185 (+) Transcript_137100:62-616(+)
MLMTQPVTGPWPQPGMDSPVRRCAPGRGHILTNRPEEGADASQRQVWPMPVQDVQAPPLVFFGPDMFKGRWLDSLGNKVFVCFEDELATTLVAHLTKPPRPDLKLSMRPVPRGGGWQCGNAVLDPSSEWPEKLCWVTADGRVSTWARWPDLANLVASGKEDRGNFSVQTSLDDEIVCATPESWD